MEKRKEFTFRGKTVEELKKLDVREFAKLLRARQRRSVLRNFQDIENFVKLIKEKQAKNKSIKTHLRNLVVVPEMVGIRLNIYNGKVFNQVDVTGEMLGHVFGEFSLTRTKTNHSKTSAGAVKVAKPKTE